MADLVNFTNNEQVINLFTQLLKNGQLQDLQDLLVDIQNKENRQMVLNNLCDNDKARIDLSLMFDELKSERKKQIVNLHFDQIKEKVFNDYLATKSEKTRKLYRYNIEKYFFNYVSGNKIDIPAMTIEQSDKFIIYVKSLDLSDKTKANILASVSSFYDYLNRIENVKNPFKNSPLMPKKTSMKNIKAVIIPDDRELDTILAQIKTDNQKQGYFKNRKCYYNYYEIISFIAKYGLRCGAIEQSKVYRQNKDGKYYFETITKGKTFKLEIDKQDYLALHNIDLSVYSGDRIKNYFRLITTKLFKQGKIKAVYSIHDLRHYFAINQYKSDKDIYKLQKLLNHSSIMTTEIYLKSLDLI